MKAWRVHEHGDPADVLRLDTIDPPSAIGDDVEIAVDTCALNFADALLCRGTYQERPPLPFTPGLEVCGRTVADGRPVIALPRLPHGGLAERAVARPADVFVLPEGLEAEVATALPITYQTGWFALHERARIQAGETLLVHAGAGGVGSAAIELGVAAGARVLATAGGPAKTERCLALGAELAIDYRADDFVAAVNDATDGRGANVIFDPVGGEVFDRSRKCIAFSGRLLVIGFASGTIPSVPANHLLVKNYAVVGLHWGGYRLHHPDRLHTCHDELLRLLGEGRIHPLVSEVHPLADAATALAGLEGGRTVGKVVVRVSG